MDIKAELSALSDEEYRKFHSRLLPGTEHSPGVRVPSVRSTSAWRTRRRETTCFTELWGESLTLRRIRC